MTSILSQFGTLRLMLLTLTAIVIVMAPGGDNVETRAGWSLVSTVIVPALSPMIVMGLLLDALMSRVWMSGASEETCRRYRRIIWTNLAMCVAVIVTLIPYLRSLAP